MQKKCDIYLCEEISSDFLKFVKVLDRNFQFEDKKKYSGYLFVDIDRVKLVPVVSDLRMNRISCFSVPVEYRDCENISVMDASIVAGEYAKTKGASITVLISPNSKSSPAFWVFNLIPIEPLSDEKAGGVVMIDRLDGHVWTYSEYEEYMYDYNNLF